VRLRWFFVFFLVSGFCGLVDEVVWLRIAMAQFGVVTPLVSTVLSVFMAGLALGSWQGGRLAKRAAGWRLLSPLRLYAAAELCIATSAFAVPPLLRFGREQLMTGKAAATWGSLRYHVAAGACIAPVLLPFCLCMGATFPLAMAALRTTSGERASKTFSHLYVANVLGATCGTLASAFLLVELLGFRGTLLAAAALNVAIAVAAFLLGPVRMSAGDRPAPPDDAAVSPPVPGAGGAALLTMLFTTGLVSMAMEVVWVRQFTPYLGTVVYAFAIILGLYLLATFLGSAMYRLTLGPGGSGEGAWALRPAWIAAGLAGLLPLVATDPRIPLPIIDPSTPQPADLFIGGMRVVLGLTLFCGVVGFITPMLVDRFSSGDPEKAGRAYAVNVLGCILGPLVACFGLLPAIGERGAIAVLSLALLLLAPLAAAQTTPAPDGRRRGFIPGAAIAGALAAGLVVVLATEDYTGLFPSFEVRRDYEATVIATDARGRKELLVNGVGITALTPITKVMVHLPMSFLETPPKSALVICFGMGTSFRSALSWGVPTTAAELVPSVPRLFGFYHADGPELLRSPLARVVIDDGRRFLERTQDQFDVITIDPPPPVEAAGSSMLYSREFYALARRRLRPGGILQQWFPGGEPAIVVSVTRAIIESFPHVRIFPSVAGWGFHFLASDRPIPDTPAAALASRLPPRAGADLVEWFEGVTPEQVFEKILSQEIKPDPILATAPGVPALTDDQPFNEYYLLRRVMN
jgi:spermidine synthase